MGSEFAFKMYESGGDANDMALAGERNNEARKIKPALGWITRPLSSDEILDQNNTRWIYRTILLERRLIILHQIFMNTKTLK